MVGKSDRKTFSKMEEVIEGTVKTPEFRINHDTGEISIRGISIPENPRLFYSSVYSAIDEYLRSPNSTTTVNFDLEYFNSSSAIAIRDIIRKFEVHPKSDSCTINWYHDEDDHGIRNSGLEYKNIFPSIRFEIIGLERDS